MKLFHPSIIFLSAAAGVCSAAFTLPWSTLDGGGGKSTGTSAGGTVYTLTGTIGQFDTSATAAGAHKVTGGFWAQLVDSPLPDYPRLTLVRFPNGDASLQWQSDAAGWQVETSTNLITWSNLGSTITSSGTLTITYDPAVPKQFFRLKRP